MPAPALLGKDTAYWQSVHQAGQGLLKERQEAVKKEKDAWQAKVYSRLSSVIRIQKEADWPCDSSSLQ